MTTTTNTHAGLLADIIENPEADDLRLIYADWLDDHGEEERAEFIRVQVELYATYGKRLDRLRPIVPTHECVLCGAFWKSSTECWNLASNSAGSCCDNTTMGDQIMRLSPEAVALFTKELAASFIVIRRLCDRVIPEAVMSHDSPVNPLPYLVLPGPVYVNLTFRRGFVAEVHAPIAVLLEHLPAIVRQHPIERVRTTDKEPERYAAVSDLWPNHWSWWSNNDNDPSSVQKQVWSLLDGFDPGYTSMDEECKNYPTAEAAHAALSVALLTLARR